MTGECRLAAYDTEDESWDYRYMDVQNISHKVNHQITDFHPIMIRAFTTWLAETFSEDIGGGEENVWPSVLVDFGQYAETVTLKCYYARDDADREKYMEWWSGLRKWLIQVQTNSDKELYLQLYVGRLTNNDNPRIKFTPLGVPVDAGNHLGFTGRISGWSLDGFKADKFETLEYTIQYMIGKVVAL